MTFNNDIDLLHMWLYGIYLYSKYEVSIISCSKVKGIVKFVNFEFNWLLTLKDDLDLDKSSAQNMRYICKPNMKSLSVMTQKLWPYVKISNLTYMYIWPLTLMDDIDLNTSPLKICIRYMCKPNMKSLSVMVQKLWP